MEPTWGTIIRAKQQPFLAFFLPSLNSIWKFEAIVHQVGLLDHQVKYFLFWLTVPLLGLRKKKCFVLFCFLALATWDSLTRDASDFFMQCSALLLSHLELYLSHRYMIHPYMSMCNVPLLKILSPLATFITRYAVPPTDACYTICGLLIIPIEARTTVKVSYLLCQE